MPVVRKSQKLDYPQDFLFYIALDVARYKEFLPGVKESSIFDEKSNSFKGSLTLGKGPLTVDYTSTVEYEKYNWIKASCVDKTFKNLLNTWTFSKIEEQSTLVTCHVDFSLAAGNFLLNLGVESLLMQTSSKLLDAFCKRAQDLKQCTALIP